MQTPHLPRNADPKVRRIEAGWLDVDTETARWLASLGDEIVVANRTLSASSHAFIALDNARRDLVIAPGTGAVELTCPTALLAIPVTMLRAATERIPALFDAWARALDTTPAPVAG